MMGIPTLVLPLPCELRELLDDKFKSNTAIILQYPEHVCKAIELDLGNGIDSNGAHDNSSIPDSNTSSDNNSVQDSKGLFMLMLPTTVSSYDLT
jgi:hypothetical protein